MTSDTVTAIAALLTRAEAAHAVYETTELRGVYDEAWPAWYADYAVRHGIGDLLGKVVTSDLLAPILASAFDDFRTTASSPDASWATFVAGRIAAAS